MKHFGTIGGRANIHAPGVARYEEGRHVESGRQQPGYRAMSARGGRSD